MFIESGITRFDFCDFFENIALGNAPTRPRPNGTGAGGAVCIANDAGAPAIRRRDHPTTVSFTSCNIHGNTAARGQGGGVYVSGILTMNACNIYENTAVRAPWQSCTAREFGSRARLGGPFCVML